MLVIEVHDLQKRYGALSAVRGVDFAVAAGEVFCLLGPNGAGKTTTTEILEGYRSRDGGAVCVLGHDPGRGDRALRERIGIVLQSCGVQPELTVAELLDMYGRYYPRRRRTDDLIKLVELDAKATTRVDALSGGQRRRLDLALGLVGDPDLLFLDEPTTGFDPSARRQAWSTIRSLCSLGKTVFLTTHFMDEAQELADRIAVMRDGEIVAAGTPAEIGGRDHAACEIRFHLPLGVRVNELPAVDASVECDAGRVVMRTQQAVAVTSTVANWALAHGHQLPGFSVAQPSLEDIYLRLTAEPSEGAIR